MNFISKVLTQKNFLWVSLLVILSTFVLFFNVVDLEPKITQDFFFSADSKVFQQDMRIKKEFPQKQRQLIIGLPHSDLKDKNYINDIQSFSEDLLELEGVDSLFSLTHGPSDVEEGIHNPLWKRLLIGGENENPSVSFIVTFLKAKNPSETIREIEKLEEKFERKGREVKISGVPYFVEQMKRNLTQDMKNFTIAAIILCGLTLLIVFRSFNVLLFSFITCISASALTLVVLAFLGYGIGILTANLLVISYVLTQSHLIFLTSNYLNLGDLQKSVKKTFGASFWCMLTTLLGFLGLVFVEAKPLSELGIGGTIGTLVAFLCAYLIFPRLLYYVPQKSKKGDVISKSLYSSKKRGRLIAVIFFVLALVLGTMGLSQINTDPSLLAYFDKEGSIAEQIRFVDKNGGSNPLLFVVERKDGKELNDHEAYKMMWNLQESLNQHQDVGSIISLPVIMAESNENWIASLLPWNLILDILESDNFDKIAKSFVSEDRKQALFFLRMKESDLKREETRNEVIQELERSVDKVGFSVKMIGGTYFLQGQLAQSVKTSIITGVCALVTIFSLILLIISRSLKLSLWVGLSAFSLSLIVFGFLGMIKVPIDIISSPAINIALGIAVDSTIHITRSARMKGALIWNNWLEALKEQVKPACISMLTIVTGFSVFAFSSFPPSQRFGGVVVLGTFLALPMALFMIPSLGSRKKES